MSCVVVCSRSVLRFFGLILDVLDVLVCIAVHVVRLVNRRRVAVVAVAVAVAVALRRLRAAAQRERRVGVVRVLGVLEVFAFRFVLARVRLDRRQHGRALRALRALREPR
jgi:hypothetical protein